MSTPRQYSLLILCLLSLPLFSVPGGLADGLAAENTGIDHERQYRSCNTLTYREPWEAFDRAEAWAALDGGAPARHCAAMALLEAKQYDRAAQRLEALAATLPSDHYPSPGDVLAQAANVWLLGGRVDMALQAIELAIQFDPGKAAYLVDRGRIRAEQGEHAAALIDLDNAIALDDRDDDAIAFRASALRHLGRAGDAMIAIERALSLNPGNPSARLERGILRHDAGERNGARSDWLRVLQDHRGTPAADAAQARLEKMDVRTE